MMAFNIGGESDAIGAMINAGASALLFTAAGDIANSLAQVNFVGPLPANEQALRTAFGSSGFAIGRATLHALAGCIGNAVAGQSCGSGAAGAFVGKLAQLSFADSSFANSEFGRMPEGGFIIAATAGCAGGFAGGGGATGCGGGAAMAAAGYLFNELAGTTTCRQRGYCTGDTVSNDRIWRLAGELKLDVVSFINTVEDELGVRLRVTQGFRTFKEQEEYYAQGRTAPGPIVTNARGGESNHNFGYAIDVARLTTNNGIDWMKIDGSIAEIASRFNLSWGGTWKQNPDYPHFERLSKNRKLGS